jgi:hypothetical protein
LSQYPFLLDDQIISSFTGLIGGTPQDEESPVAQVLLLRLSELQRTQQSEQLSGQSQRPSSTNDEREWVGIHAESDGIAINQMFGDIYQVESYGPPDKRWQPPRHHKLRKAFVGRQEELQMLLDLYWLLSTSVREIDPLGIHRPPLSGGQVGFSQ